MSAELLAAPKRRRAGGPAGRGRHKCLGPRQQPMRPPTHALQFLARPARRSDTPRHSTERACDVYTRHLPPHLSQVRSAPSHPCPCLLQPGRPHCGPAVFESGASVPCCNSAPTIGLLRSNSGGTDIKSIRTPHTFLHQILAASRSADATHLSYPGGHANALVAASRHRRNC